MSADRSEVLRRAKARDAAQLLSEMPGASLEELQAALVNALEHIARIEDDLDAAAQVLVEGIPAAGN
jgi:hypothetical protein